MSNTIKLSILNQSRIRKGETAHRALIETAESAKLADQLGYTHLGIGTS